MNFNSLNALTAEQAKKEIESTLDKQHDKFMTTKWSELISKKQMLALPEWYLEDFFKILRYVRPKEHEVFAVQLELILKTKLEDLKFGQVGLMNNFFIMVEPFNWVDTNEDFVKKLRVINALIQEFNEQFKKLNADLINTRMSMQERFAPQKSLIIN